MSMLSCNSLTVAQVVPACNYCGGLLEFWVAYVLMGLPVVGMFARWFARKAGRLLDYLTEVVKRR